MRCALRQRRAAVQWYDSTLKVSFSADIQTQRQFGNRIRFTEQQHNNMEQKRTEQYRTQECGEYDDGACACSHETEITKEK